MIRMAPVDWYVDLLNVDLDHLDDPREGNHVVVYVDTGQETFIIETTNDVDMLPYDKGVTGWLAGNLHKEHNPQPVYLR
jgi:hypothetical protein